MQVELSHITVKRALVMTLVLAAAGCRGEKVPRDYQNAPPAMTHSPTTSSGTPTAHGMPGPSPEPNHDVEGSTQKPVNPVPTPPQKLKDQAPPTTATTTVQTGTHLATRP
jgi:hypothetical protein